MAEYGIDLSDLSNFTDSISEMPTGLDSWANFDWGNFGSNYFDAAGSNWLNTSPDVSFSPQWRPELPDVNEMQTGWPGGIYGPGGEGPLGSAVNPKGSAGSGDTDWGGILDKAAKGGVLLKNFAEPALGIEKVIQNAQYGRDYAKWVKAQNDYIKKKQEYEAQFMGEFAQSQERFRAANEEFQGQIEAASGQANEVLQQYLNAAKPLLAQSQELLVPGVAALARGEVPEQWQPILNAAKQKATAAAIQSMVSAGMSEEDARASIGPKVDQDAHQMLLALASSMMTQGLATGAQGGQFLQGAGQMASVLGQLAAAGMGPMTQEFMNMLQVVNHILSPSSLVPPGKPTA